MRRIMIVKAVFLIGACFSLLIACNENSPSPTVVSVGIPSSMESTSLPATVTPSQIPDATSTFAVTVDATDQARRGTAMVMAGTANVLRQQTAQAEANKIAQFPPACAERANGLFISRDGQWLATSCDSKSDQSLVIMNKDRVRWELKFKDFIHPDSFLDGQPPMGTLYPEFWSPDGVYLYFSPSLGYSGGGDQCFPTFKGRYGLFRLNLKNGTWVTLIPPTDAFPGYGIAFSETSRRYAADLNGVTITDLYTGDVVMLDVPATVEGLSWSPDGTRLAYTVASCGDELVESSSVYIWDAATNQAQKLFTEDGVLLRPDKWMDDSTLVILGEQYVNLDTIYTVYEYNIPQGNLIFSGTLTPLP